MIGGDADVGVADIALAAVLPAIDADVAQDFDAGRVGRDEEHRRALVALLGVGVGHRHHDQQVGPFGVGREPFLAVDHPFVAVEIGARDETGRVGSALRLGHRKGRDDLVIEQRPEIALLLLGRAVMRDDLGIAGVGRLAAEHAGREPGAAEDFVHQPELDLAIALAAEFGAEMARPQALRLDLFLQRPDERVAYWDCSRRRGAGRGRRGARPRRGRSRPSSRAFPEIRGRFRNPMPLHSLLRLSPTA